MARRQLADDVLAWLTKEALPAEIYPAWAYTGIGESTLTASGETDPQRKAIED